MRDISKQQNLPYNAVRYWMEKYNIERRSRVESSFYGFWKQKKRLNCLPQKLTIKDINDLYYKKGYSAKETGKCLNRSVSNIYKFMRKYGLPRRTATQTNSIIYNRKETSYCLKNNLTIKEQKLKVAGIMLYWGEGSKNNSMVDLANSDPDMIKVFLRFLRDICGVDEDRLRAQLYCYSNQNLEFIKSFWQRVTKIPGDKFCKPYIRNDFLPEKIGKMKYGLVHVRYADKKLLLQIKKWIDDYLKNI